MYFDAPVVDLDPADTVNLISLQSQEFTLLVYQNDFETPAGAEWCNPTRTTAPNGQTFLGEFGNQTACLDISGLPTHDWVRATFDIYILRSWEGSEPKPGHPELAPDIWNFVADGLARFTTTFANQTGFGQQFPGSLPGPTQYPLQTGASAVNSLGYTFAGSPMDATYHIELLFSHSAGALHLDFLASGLQGLEDESWGLDNLSLTIYPMKSLYANQVYLPMLKR